MFGKNILNPVQERDVSVRSQEGGTNITVFRKDRENVFDEREAVLIERADRMGMDQIFNLPGQFIFNLFHHVIDIRIV